MKFSRSLALAAVPLLAALTACSGGSGGADGNTVRIGTTEAGDRSWEIFEDKAKDAGITLDVVNFSDYSQPNVALSQGQIDANLFQHLQFLGEYNTGADDDLTPIGATQIVPLGLYSQKHQSLADIPQGAEIAIPNDPSNQARALFVLNGAGLLTLTGDNPSPTPADIDTTASKVKVTPVDAAQTALSLASVDARSSTTRSSSVRASTPNPLSTRTTRRAPPPSPTSTPSSPAPRTRTTRRTSNS